MSDAPPGAKVRIWDLPTRLFHWLIVLLVPALWFSHKIDRVDIHISLGLVMLGLVLFRILWGLIGGSTARFAAFVRGPGAVLRYLRGGYGRAFGHNPIGGWSVMLMLSLLAVQIGLGLFAIDEDGLECGPLSKLISYDAARGVAHWHERVFYILLAVIALHVAAILFYALVRRDNLVPPMINGRGEPGEGAGELRPASLWRFVAAAAFSAAITLWISGIL